MKLKENIYRQLSQLAGSTVDEPLLSLDVGVGQLKCQFTAIDSMSCSFRNLELATNRLAGATLERLKELSDALARRLSYLLEPIGVVESDDEHCVVQMRSNPPQEGEGETSYYELLLRTGGTINLCRYQKIRGKARQLVPATVTHEVLARLAADFVDAV